MKVIVSHDVDHLHPSEHFFRDLYFPKLWVRSFIEYLKGEIGLKVFFNRILLIFNKRLNRIAELCDFDSRNCVKATYFFGMDSVLSMSYKKEKALPYIRYVKDAGFDAGVHGCNFDNVEAIKKEHNAFQRLTGESQFGVRNHYVRYNGHTFGYMNDACYIFDTTEFNKDGLDYKHPYKVGNMWEFPLAIMDVYVVHHNLQDAKDRVKAFIQSVIKNEGSYLTVLFHDSLFNQKCYPLEYAFYVWLIKYLKECGVEFISYRKAIEELDYEG